jgi:hydrogenase expression/formation protein HypD
VRYVDEYRDGDQATRFSERLRQLVTRPWHIMEVCGGQTHAIVRFGIDELLPDRVTLIHGPAVPSASRQSRSSTRRSPSLRGQR